MKRSLFVLAFLAAWVPAEALVAQVEISARGADLRIGGRLHTQYQTSSAEGSDAEFFFRRARITFDVNVTDFFTARVQPEFAGGSAELVDAYVRFNFSDAFRLTMGQFKRPFDLFELDSSTEMSIIERDGRVDGVDSCAGVGRVCTYGRFSSALGLGNRDQGLLAEGSFGRFSVAASMTNGTGINTSDENDEKTFMGRVGFEITDQIAVGAQYAHKDYVAGVDDEYAGAWAVDAQYGGYRDGLLVQAAVISGDNWRNLQTSGDPTTFLGWQALGSWYFPMSLGNFEAIEPLFRISGGDPNTDLDDDGGMVLTPGVMFYISGRNKLGFNVDYYTPETGDAEWSLKIQSYLYF